MRVQLVPQVLELGFRADSFRFYHQALRLFPGVLRLHPSASQLDGCGYAYHHCQGKDVPQHEKYPGIGPEFRPCAERDREKDNLEQLHQYAYGQHYSHIHQYPGPCLPFEKEAGYEYEVIQIEDQAE